MLFCQDATAKFDQITGFSGSYSKPPLSHFLSASLRVSSCLWRRHPALAATDSGWHRHSLSTFNNSQQISPKPIEIANEEFGRRLRDRPKAFWPWGTAAFLLSFAARLLPTVSFWSSLRDPSPATGLPAAIMDQTLYFECWNAKLFETQIIQIKLKTRDRISSSMKTSLPTSEKLEVCLFKAAQCHQCEAIVHIQHPKVEPCTIAEPPKKQKVFKHQLLCWISLNLFRALGGEKPTPWPRLDWWWHTNT